MDTLGKNSTSAAVVDGTDNERAASVWLRLWYFGPLLLWAVFIFVMSTSAGGNDHSEGIITTVLKLFNRSWFDSLSQTQVESINYFVRKLGHISEYFIFAVLAARAVVGPRKRFNTGYALKTLVITIVYAATDELHQYFVPGRSAAIGDVLIDAAGAGLALLVLIAISSWRSKRARQSS